MRTYEKPPINSDLQLIEFDEFVFDFSNHTLFHKGELVELQHKPSEILALLLRSKGQLVTRDDIVEAVWGDQIVDFDQNINFSIKCIRKALNDDPRKPRFVQTIPRKGYQFIASARPLQQHKQPSDASRAKTQLITRVALPLVAVLIGVLVYLFPQQESKPERILEPANQDLKRAQYLLDKGDYQSVKTSQSIFLRLAQTAESSAQVYAGLAITTVLNTTDPEQKQAAIEYAQQAYNKDSNNWLSHLAMGMVAFYIHWDMPQARHHLTKASEINAESVRAWHELSVVQTIMGDFQNAEHSIEKALEIDPGRVQEIFHSGWFYLATHQYEKALEQCKKSIEIAADHTFSHLCMVEAAIELKLYKTAREHMSSYMRLLKATDVSIKTVASASNEAMADVFYRWRLSFLLDSAADDFHLALAYAQLGDDTNALKALQAAIEKGHAMVPTALAYNQFGSLRNNQEFKHMISAVKLVKE